jgi:hypothetical protein
METASSKVSLRKWLLRIFLGSFVLAIAAPVVLAMAALHLSSDTRALRNAAINGDGSRWKKQIEVNVGALPFWIARCVLPFTQAPVEAQQALSAVRSAEVSVHELSGAAPDRSRILRDADAKMRARGWDRVVGVLQRETAVAVYAIPETGGGGNMKVSVLVLDGRQMVAVTGRARLEPLLELAMDKAEHADHGFLAKHRRKETMVAEAHRE